MRVPRTFPGTPLLAAILRPRIHFFGYVRQLVHSTAFQWEAALCELLTRTGYEAWHRFCTDGRGGGIGTAGNA